MKRISKIIHFIRNHPFGAGYPLCLKKVGIWFGSFDKSKVTCKECKKKLKSKSRVGELLIDHASKGLEAVNSSLIFTS